MLNGQYITKKKYHTKKKHYLVKDKNRNISLFTRVQSPAQQIFYTNKQKTYVNFMHIMFSIIYPSNPTQENIATINKREANRYDIKFDYQECK